MELNNKQRELCLQHALEQFLGGWEGTAQEAWDRLSNFCAEHTDSGTATFEEATSVSVCAAYEHLCLADLIELIEAAFLASQQSVKDVYRLGTPEPGVITIDVEGGLVMDVFGLPDGWSYEVNDLDILD